jgi:DNA-binding FadR family transcriptional regulator
MADSAPRPGAPKPQRGHAPVVARPTELDKLIFRPVAARNTFEETVERLAHAIKLGVVAPGERFPSERVLAPQLGVSRVTLREALRALEQAGYIESRRGRNGGAYVIYRDGRSASTSTAKRAVRAMGDSLFDRLQFRRALEPAAAQLAAERAREVGAAHLTELSDDAATAAEADYRGRDLRLHLAIAELTGSPALVDAIAGLQTQLSDLLGAFPIVEASLRHSDQQHGAIVRAIQAGRAPRARQLMEAHVDATANLIRGFLG